MENDIPNLFIPVYRANFSGSRDIKIYSIRQLQRILRDAKRNKYGSAVKCGTAGKRKCGKVRYCQVKGYAVKCGTASQGVKEGKFSRSRSLCKPELFAKHLCPPAATESISDLDLGPITCLATRIIYTLMFISVPSPCDESLSSYLLHEGDWHTDRHVQSTAIFPSFFKGEHTKHCMMWKIFLKQTHMWNMKVLFIQK